VEVLFDESVLEAGNQGFLLTSTVNRLTALGEQKAFLEAQIFEWSTSLKKLALLGIEFCAVVAAPFASNISPESNQSAEVGFSLAHPRCQCCGAIEQIDSCPQAWSWSSPPPALCSRCVAMNQIFDPARGSGAFFRAVIEEIVEIWELVTTAEWLVSLIIAARAFLVSRLPKAFFECGFAVCQRSFFTHHGAHPPDNAALTNSGLFPERVLQPLGAS
jgi:hypothetical protein